MVTSLAPWRVLFLCIHNSARSQMAASYLQHFGGDKFEVESAGLEAGKLNPFAVEAMLLDGIDISHNTTTDVQRYLKEGRQYHYVITVCDEATASRCPVFPGQHKKLHWSFADPSSFVGSYTECLQKTIAVRDEIKRAVLSFLSAACK